MKNFLNTLTFALFASLIIFASCGGGDKDEDSAEDIAAAELTSGLATLVSVENGTGNGDTELDWTGFTIQFTGTAAGGTYAIDGVPTGGEAIWPTSPNTWEFVEGSTSSVTRGDGIVVGISVTETTLEMSFTYTEASARVKDITGPWVFTMEF